MVYLGLQDDDGLDYGGDYEPYGDYGDHHLEDSREGSDGAPGETREPARRDPAQATVRTARDVPPDYAAPDPPPRPSGRENPSGVSMTRPAVVRTIGPVSARFVEALVRGALSADLPGEYVERLRRGQ